MAFFEGVSLGRGVLHDQHQHQFVQHQAPPPGFEKHNPSPPMSIHGRLQGPLSDSASPSSALLSLVTQQTASSASAAAPPFSAATMGPVDLRMAQMLLQEFRESDRRRDDLVLGLLRRYQTLETEYQQKCSDYEQERRSLAMFQRENRALADQLSSLKLANESNPLVFVILDGDGAIFRDDLLSRGAEGGTDAAFELLTQIRKHIRSIYPEAQVEDWTIMVQYVVNLEGQARTLHAAGIVHDGFRDLNAFAHAFGQAQSLFSFVDVGSGKERADHKIRETMRVMARLSQCKHVLFGPCADNGYLPFLEPYKHELGNKLSLLETTPPMQGFIQLNLSLAKFPSVFRSEPIVRPFGSMGNSAPLLRNGSMPANSASSNHMPPPAPPQQQRQQQFPVLSPLSPVSSAAEAGGGSRLQPLRPPKAASAPPQPATAPPPGTPSYATAGNKTTSAASASKSFDIAPKKPAPALKYYYVNSSSERIDEELPRVAPIAEKRYMDRKNANGRNFCNNYHLLGYCDGGDYCQYEHGDYLSSQELLVQKHRARGTYCGKGIGCDDFDCYYSHHCRFGRECGMGHKCKFNDTHHMDLGGNGRKVAKIFEDGTKEMLH